MTHHRFHCEKSSSHSNIFKKMFGSANHLRKGATYLRSTKNADYFTLQSLGRQILFVTSVPVTLKRSESAMLDLDGWHPLYSMTPSPLSCKLGNLYENVSESLT